MSLNKISINDTTTVNTGIVYDISKAHDGATYTDLADALSGNNVPTEVREGGMTVRFVHTSDNKYIQVRCMAQDFTTDVTQWQGEWIQDTDSDFEVTDENGAAILKINDGTITTKNFNSDKTVKTDTAENFDLAISDEDGNIILAIKDGNIKTKKFDSGEIEPQEEINLDTFRSKTGLVYSKFFNLSTDVSDLVITGGNNSVTADGIYLSGSGNVILNKYFSLANRTIEYLCKFTASSISVFTTDQDGPVIKVDMITHKFSISNGSVIEEIAIDTGIESHLFKVLITKNYQEQIAKLVDVTVNKVYTVSKTQDGEGGAGQGSLNPTPTIIGMQNDKYKFYETNDAFYVKNIKIYSNVNNVKLVMYGDSITEPEAYYPKENFGASWTQLVISQVNGKAVSSGRVGTNIDEIFSRISNELPYINAKYVMVTIGTNGGNTVEKLRQLVDYIKFCGATPILNNIPCNDNNGTSNTAENNAMIQQVRTEKGIKGCLFNIATSEDGDGETLDYSMMYYEDYPGVGTWYHHPNPKGAEAMFLRTFVDIPEIYD